MLFKMLYAHELLSLLHDKSTVQKVASRRANPFQVLLYGFVKDVRNE
jgi:hypothetical protein